VNAQFDNDHSSPLGIWKHVQTKHERKASDENILKKKVFVPSCHGFG